MGNATEKLNGTLTATLDALHEAIINLSKAATIIEKQQLADIIRLLSESQKHIVESIGLLSDDDLGFMNDSSFEDDFYDESDEELNEIIDTRKICVRKDKGIKNRKTLKKLEDEDLPF